MQGPAGKRRARKSPDLVTVYLQQASRTELLTRTDEQRLFKRMEEAQAARLRLVSDDLSASERRQLLATVQDGLAAREHVIRANLRLVVSVAKSFRPAGIMDFMDLIAFGNVGLLRAIPKFDYRRGHKFSTYAVWWIRQSISRALDEYSRVIRLPAYILDQLRRLRDTESRLEQKLGQSLTPFELAERLEEPEEDVRELHTWEARLVTHSLERLQDEKVDPLELIPDPEGVDPELHHTRRSSKRLVFNLLERLPARKAKLIELRFGLRDGHPRTLAEIGRKLGVTRERARQMEASALDELREIYAAIQPEPD